MRSRLLLALASVAFAMLLTEGALRAATGDDFLRRPFSNVDWVVRDPVYVWMNRPGFSGPASVAGVPLEAELRFDVNGLLGEPRPFEKPKGTSRILCLGDSGTFGIWFEAQADGGVRARWNGYPGALERALRARGHANVDVVNAGVVGHTSAHGLRHLATRLAGFEIDVLVVRFGYNDHARSWDPALAAAEPRPTLLRQLFYALHEWKLLRLALAAGQALPRNAAGKRGGAWVSLEAFARNHRRFAELGRENGYRVIFVDYPLRPRDWEGSPQDRQLAFMHGVGIEEIYASHAAYQDALRKLAGDTGVPLVETRRDLSTRGSPGFGRGDFVHPNQTGSRRIATRVADTLEELGWLR